MSGTNSSSPPGANGGGDPSMEDILASIRRILAEDEPVAGATPGDGGAADANGAGPAGAPAGLKDDVLVLDSSMLAPAEPVTTVAAPVTAPAPTTAPVTEAVPAAPALAEVLSMPAPMTNAATATSGAAKALLDGEAPPLIIRNTLPCFEDVVREALQPVIKQWLDAALPKLVERLVRTEVERVVGGVVQ